MKVRYSLEAFALAMVLFTSGLEIALIAGAVIVAGTVIGDTLADKAGRTAAAVIGGVVTGVALIGGLIYTGLGDKAEYIGAVLVAVLVFKHVKDGVDEASTGEVLKDNYVALAVMAVVAVVRELLVGGAVFGYEIGSFAVASSAYAKLYFGLIFGGLGIAAVNTILKKEVSTDSLWVAVPAMAMMVVAVFVGGASAGKILANVVAAVIAVVLLMSVRGKMIFSTPGKHFAGLPVEMISLGFLGMMVSVVETIIK